MIDNVIKKHGPKTSIAIDRNEPDKEPNCKDLFAVNVRGDLTPTKQPCRDILFSLGPMRKLLDVVISLPVAQSEPRVTDNPGFAAHAVALKNENLYYNNFAIPEGQMVPLSAETGGRL